MSAKNLKIDSLKLDLRNPRIGQAANQHGAMQAILDDQQNKLANLAANIVENNSLNPMDRLLVMKDDDGKYIVLEGNRRILALKILLNPKLLGGLIISQHLKKRFEKLAVNFERSSVEPIACYVVADRAEGNSWIEQRHRGADEGRGIVDWSSEAIRNFAGNDPALQALEFVRRCALLSADEQEMLATRFPLTTLDRLLSTPSVRKSIGFEINEGKLITAMLGKEALKPLRRMVLDLASKKINVTALKLVRQQNEYIATFSPHDLPDFSTKLDILRPVDELDAGDFASEQNARGRSGENAEPNNRKKSANLHSNSATPSRAQRVLERKTIVPKACRLNITNNKVLEIYKELSNLKLPDFPNSIAVLLRVFMENSVDHYLDRNSIPLKFTRPGSGERFKSLETKIREAVEHMVVTGADRSYFDGVKRALSDSNHPLSIDLQHAYVHNRFVSPTVNDLVVAWNNAQYFFEKIWP